MWRYVLLPGSLLPGFPRRRRPQDDLKREVEKISEKIRCRPSQQGYRRWLSCYTSAYPNLGRVENQMLELWKNYDIKEVSYRISNVQRVSDSRPPWTSSRTYSSTITAPMTTPWCGRNIKPFWRRVRVAGKSGTARKWRGDKAYHGGQAIRKSWCIVGMGFGIALCLAGCQTLFPQAGVCATCSPRPPGAPVVAPGRTPHIFCDRQPPQSPGLPGDGLSQDRGS